MQLNKLPKIKISKAKRVGRGYGSGRGGHTSGRGSKGQKARGKVALIFEGTKVKKSFIKRLPLLRGRGKLKPRGPRTLVINISQLTDWPEKTPVTEENLIKHGLITKYRGEKIKILGDGEVKKALDIKVSTSAPAEDKIVKAGGKVWKKS